MMVQNFPSAVLVAQHKSEASRRRHMLTIPRLRENVFPHYHNNVDYQPDAIPFVEFYDRSALEVSAYFFEADMER